MKGMFLVVLWLCSVATMAQTPSPPPRGDEATTSRALQEAGPENPDNTRARSVVQRADESRFPQEAFQVDVVVNSTIGGEAQEPRRYRVLSKGSDNNIVLTLEPEIERGQNMLLKGRELWIFMPNVSQPVRLSLSQRLTGQVANGDLARANFSGDYTPRLIGEERVAGQLHHVLDLTAAERGVTYARVKYWVRAADYLPHKAEFYSTSGRLLKTCVYERFQPMGGRVRPTRLIVTDALKPGDKSVMEYSGLKLVNLPDRYFSKQYLKKLE